MEREPIYPTFARYPHYIKVTRKPNGLLHLKTNTHTADNIPEDQISYITLPYCGVDVHAQIHAFDADGNEDIELKRRIEANLNKQTDLHIFLHDDHPVMRHHFRNLNLDPNSIRGIKDICKDRPTLFCGAGPTLKANIEYVKRAIKTNSHCVIAGGSALRILSDLEIYPHFALAFDPHPTEWTLVFEHLSEKFIKKVPLISTTGLEYRCTARYISHEGKILMSPTMSFPAMMRKLYPREPFILEGRIGVSTMMPFLAAYMGCNQLEYVGVDLSFGPSGEAYADGKATEVEQKLIQEHRGFNTKLLWVREAEDIVYNCEKLNIRLAVVDEKSMLSAYGVEKSEQEHKPNNKIKYRKLRFSITEKSLDMLQKIAYQAYTFYNTRQIDEDNEFFEDYLKSYHLVQEFRQERTGDFNMPLLRAVSRQLFDEAFDFLDRY